MIRSAPARADEVIGVETPPERQYAILDRLGFEPHATARSSCPTWRARDVTREIDVVEEIARFRLEDVPFTLPARREMFGALTREQQLRRRVEDALVGLGFAETYTPSLRPDDDTPWKLPEPISVELTALRTTLLPSLVEAARRNVDAGARADRAVRDRPRLPRRAATSPTSVVRVAGIAEGGFLHVKGVVEALYAALKAEPAFERAEHPLLHPGQDGAARRGRPRRAAPARARRGVGGVRARPRASCSPLARARHLPATSSPTRPIRQDIAVAVAEEVAGRRARRRRARGGGAELREIRVFDVYRGEQVGAGRKSVAFSVAYQSADRTLTEEDATRLRDAITAELGRLFGAELRT